MLMSSSVISRLAPAAALLALAGCEVGPDYRRPATEAPPAFSETAPWKEAAPKDTVSRAEWWKVFGDRELDRIESQTTAANPSIQAAFARVEEAQAIARVSLAGLLPTAAVNAAGARTRYSAHRQLPPGANHLGYTTNSIDLPLDLSYEVDLFGRVRRELEATRALAEAQAAAYQSVLLSLQAEAAQDYFALGGLLEEKAYFEANVEGRKRELDLVNKRQAAGASNNLDVYRARTELDSVQSSELAVDRQIAQYRHALAVLSGQMPESFKLEATPITVEPPAIPIGLPSELLERRPDIAQAERTLASVSASIGIAKAAFFPRVGLTAFGGFNSVAFHSLFDSDSKEWSVAPFISVPLFQGGRNWANYQRSKFAYDEAVANYRGQVLVAFRDVEDTLSGLRYLSDQSTVLQDGVSASRQATDLSRLRYRQGVSDYFEVIDAERSALEQQIQWSQVRAQRFVTTVLLIKALGGGWQ
jgi:multidrug efflux system outer membrane protein